MNFLDRIKLYVGQLLVQLLKDFTPSLIAEVQSPALAGGVERLLGRTEEVIRAITDENPENREQLEAILSRFLGEDVVSTFDGFSDELLLKIQNERVRRGLGLLSVPVVDALRLLTDENPDNAAQAEVVLDTFLENPEVQNFVTTDLAVPVMEKLIPNPIIRGFILQGMVIGIQQGLEELADADVFDRSKVIEELKAAKEKAAQEAL